MVVAQKYLTKVLLIRQSEPTLPWIYMAKTYRQVMIDKPHPHLCDIKGTEESKKYQIADTLHDTTWHIQAS